MPKNEYSNGLSHVYLSTEEGLVRADGALFAKEGTKMKGKPKLTWGAMWMIQRKMADLKPVLKKKTAKAVFKKDRARYKEFKKVEDAHIKAKTKSIEKIIKELVSKEGRKKVSMKSMRKSMKKSMRKSMR